MIKRIASLLLVLMMLLFPVACAADDTEKPAETTPQVIDTTAAPAETEPPVTEPAYKPELPDVKFENESLVIIHRAADAAHYKEYCLQADDWTGDIVNDAVYKRNLAIEEKYGLDIVNVVNNEVSNAIQISAQAQSDEYDVGFPQMRTISGLTTSGYLYNLHELDYVDFSKPYWDTNFNTDLTLEGKLYAMVSDISLMNLINTRGIIFNRDLAKENNLEDPYDLVHKNQWTLDKMIEMAGAVSNDLNGDQKFDDLDRYGMLTESSNFLYMCVAGGVQLIQQDADSNLSVGFNNEKCIGIIEKMASLYKDETHAIDYSDLKNTAGASAVSSYWDYGRQIFANGQILFLQNAPAEFQSIRDFGMTQEYGIVPQPKFNSEQDRYYHLPDESSTVLVVPSTNNDYERLGILLEDMAYQSNQILLPAYYETVIKIRQSPVPEVSEMMDIIKNNMIYHFGLIYSVDIASTFTSAADSGRIASSFTVAERRLNKQLENLSKALQDLP